MKTKQARHHFNEANQIFGIAPLSLGIRNTFATFGQARKSRKQQKVEMKVAVSNAVNNVECLRKCPFSVPVFKASIFILEKPMVYIPLYIYVYVYLGIQVVVRYSNSICMSWNFYFFEWYACLKYMCVINICIYV